MKNLINRIKQQPRFAGLCIAADILTITILITFISILIK